MIWFRDLPILPAGYVSSPILICPLRKVPVDRTTVRPLICCPSSLYQMYLIFNGRECSLLVMIPLHSNRSPFLLRIKSSTEQHFIVRFDVLLSIWFCICFLNNALSIWALHPCPNSTIKKILLFVSFNGIHTQTAGPLLLLSTLYWIPERSVVKIIEN